MTITCADCGQTQRLPSMPPGATARCLRCDRLLRRRSRVGIDIPLAAATAIALLLLPAIFLPLMDSTIKNLVFKQTSLVTSIPVIYGEVWFPFAFGFLFFAFVFPGVRSLLQVIVLGSIRFARPVPEAGRLFRWSEELRTWSMSEVVVVAGLIAYFRATVTATVEVGAGAWCYLSVAVLSLIVNRSLDRRTVWNAIIPDRRGAPADDHASCASCELTIDADDAGEGRVCPRCGQALDRDSARRFLPALAAIAAAIPLSIPAYAFSVIVNTTLTGPLEHSVTGTAHQLTDRGYWQFGVILILTGVVIPAVEVLGMLWLLGRVRFPGRRGLVTSTRLYRALHHMVRWPLIIPFIAAIAAPIVDFPGIDDIEAGVGATPLFLLLALILLAVRLFEPKLMWQMAGEA